MNSRALLASATLRADPNLGTNDPIFRRATANMILATHLVRELLAKIPEVAREEISFVLGTQFGEVHSSIEFLRNLRRTGVASPTAFQNSLHNSTLGFTSIQLGLTGPAFTVSVGDATPAASKNLATDLLQITPFAVVCLIDVIPVDLRKYYLARFPLLEKHEGLAQGFLFARPDIAFARGFSCLEEGACISCS